jgi:hypothetical protein
MTALEHLPEYRALSYSIPPNQGRLLWQVPLMAKRFRWGGRTILPRDR